MRIDNDFSGLLSVERWEDRIKIRLNTLDLVDPESYTDAAFEIELVNCTRAANAEKQITEFVGELVWNWDYRSDKKFELLFDGGGTIEIECESVLERRSDLTIDEVFKALQWLSDSYRRETNNSTIGWHKFRKLKDTLEFEIGQELNNWETKRSYYELNNINSKEKVDTAIHICKRVLNYVEQVDKDKQ